MGVYTLLPEEETSSLNTKPRVRISAALTTGKLADWVKRFDSTKGKDRKSLIAEGITIALQRTEALKELAKVKPAAALGEMMSMDQIASLPKAVREVSEKPLNALGDIDLHWQTSIGSDGSLQCSHQNVAVINGKSFEIAGIDYGQAQQPIANSLLNGYLIGDLILLDSSPVRTISDSELTFVEQFFPNSENLAVDPITGNPADPKLTAVIAGRRFGFENPASLKQVDETLQHTESIDFESTNPDNGNNFTWLMADSGGAQTTSTILPPPPQQGTSKVLFIRANFSDLLESPISKEDLDISLITAKSRIEDYSHAKATIEFTVTPVLYTLPISSITVAQEGDNNAIITAARDAASAHHTLADFDIVAVYFTSLSSIPESKITYGGLASIGGSNHWINGVSEFSRVSIIVHEFGHNYGLYHANYYDPAMSISNDTTDYLDPFGQSLEYGDIFDRMGSGSVDFGYFSPFAMSRITWLDPSKIQQVNASGIWRIHRFDHRLASNNPTLALRVPMGGNKYNWIALRELFPQTSQKAYIVNEGYYENHSNLVDATPGSNASPIADRSDATLPVGSSFVDPSSGITFRTIAAGGTAPNQWIDVQVDFDPRLELVNTSVIVDEAAGHAELRIKRSFNAGNSCSVAYSTAGVTATSGTDFYPVTGTITWPAGDLSEKSVLIPIRPDALIESPESLTLTLASPQGAVIAAGAATATVTIIDPGNRITSFGPPFFNNTVNSVAPLPGGKIIIGGTIYQGLTGNISRLNANGTEDTSFQKGSGFNGNVLTLVAQSDGKIVVGGEFTSYNGSTVNGIARLNSDGTLDSAFQTAIGTGPNGLVYSLAIETSGNILVGGDFNTFAGATATVLVRLLPSGARNTTAPVTTSFNSGSTPKIRSIFAQDDGKIMVGGQFSFPFASGFGFRSGIARLNSNGSRDSSFEPGYGAHLEGSTSTLMFVKAITRLTDGKYLVGGQFTAYNNFISTRMLRLNTNGSRDSTFTPPPFDGTVETILQDKAGRVIIGGRFTTPAGKIVALSQTGAINNTFNLQGGTPGSGILCLASDSSGDIFMGGNFFNFGGAMSRPIVKVAGGISQYELWKSAIFSVSQINSGNTSAEQDFDGDGILNVAEMAIGTSPTVADSPSRFAVAAGNLSLQSVSSNAYLTATMARSAENVGVWLVAQFSDDLVTWSPANPIPGNTTAYDVIESTDTRFTVRDNSQLSGKPKRFVRFKAALPN